MSSSTTAPAAPIVAKLEWKRATLSYRPPGHQDFIPLGSVDGRKGVNVSRVLVHYQLEFTQASPQRKDVAVCHIAPEDIEGQNTIENKGENDVEITVNLRRSSTMTFHGDGDGDGEHAKQFPLSTSAPTFTAVKLLLQASEMKNALRGSDTRKHLAHLLSGKSGMLDDAPLTRYVKSILELSEEESKAQAGFVLAQSDCKITTSIWKSRLVIQVWPSFGKELGDEKLQQIKERNPRLSYGTQNRDTCRHHMAGLYKLPGDV